MFFFFFFNDTATTEIYTLSLHDALPISTDLSPQLNAAMAAGADDLIGGGHFNDGLLIMNQLKTIWTPKFVSLLVAVTEPSFQAQLQATANNVTGPSQWESAVAYRPTLAQSLGLPWYRS